MPIIKDNNNLYTLDNQSGEAQRKMAAIFAADVVGYSKLMAQNEKLTLFRLKETRRITDTIINKLNGRIFSTAGDSIMAEFASPVDAVEAAIEIQNEVSKKLAEVTDNIKIEFRIGVNLGDIMVQDNNLYGDNVNIAARLEAISLPGEICLSEKVYQEIKNKVAVKFNYSGAKKLKNISEKINTYLSNIAGDDVDEKSKKAFLSRKSIIIGASAFITLGIVSYLIYDNFFSNKIIYNQSSKSVIENFKSSESTNNSLSVADEGTLKISIMDFQVQSAVFGKDSLNILMDKVRSSLNEEGSISTVNSAAGSENLNPPEVMLIATEANSAFVINGVIFSSENKEFLSIKIYESKRGSMIINKKIELQQSNNFNELTKFLSLFKNDILN